MLLPCSEWEEHGYPAKPGASGVPLTLDVGALGARVAFSVRLSLWCAWITP